MGMPGGFGSTGGLGGTVAGLVIGVGAVMVTGLDTAIGPAIPVAEMARTEMK